MRRRQGGLVANEVAMLELLADVHPSWTTTSDLLWMARERHLAGNWPGKRAPHEATVYRILERFRAHGWVQANWWVPDDPWSKDRPARIVAITDAGRARARELRGEAA